MAFELLYWHWVVAGIMLVILEMFLPSFTILWFGAGAVIVGILTYIFPEISIWGQMLIWSLSSLLLAILWFKYIKPLSARKKLTKRSAEHIEGEIGLVIHASSGKENKGRLRFPAPLLGDDEWDFICEEKVKLGDKVQVADISGNQLIVKKP